MPQKKTGLKICVGASAGGHMNELLQLLAFVNSWPVQPSFYITTMDLLSGLLSEKGSTYVIGECNRHHPFLAVVTLYRCLKIALKERPDVVITTGSMPLALFCLVSKLLVGTKIVWIDSIANIEKFSMSGRLIYSFADLFLTQWPDLATEESKAKFAGALL
jgi:UDP-N-acetylglucosamine:LPS N-acetylglucosamine transferase